MKKEGTMSVGFKRQYETLAKKGMKTQDVKELSLPYPSKINNCLQG